MGEVCRYINIITYVKSDASNIIQRLVVIGWKVILQLSNERHFW